MGEKNPLSIIVLTYNEEKNIEECLNSVSDWVDEIFIVDSFSTDKTLEIAKKYDVKIVQHNFEYHAAQKNWALCNLPFKNSWVFFLDADERITPELKKEIMSVLRKPLFDGYYVARKNYFMNRWIKHGGWYPDWQLRFFKHQLGRFEDRLVHEHVILDGNVGYLKKSILHYDFKGFERYFDRHNIYSSREALEAYKVISGNKKNQINPAFLKKGPHRRRWLKELAYKYIPCRPLLKFIYMYFLKLGVLDGCAGFHYCVLHTFYEYQISLKIQELKRGNSPLLEKQELNHININEEFEIDRPHNAGKLYSFLISYKFKKILDTLPFSVKHMSVLDICCGSGMVSELYSKNGANVTGIDLDERAIERAKIRAKRYNFVADFKVADAINLPFSDNSFDIVSVHDGLHHLKNPCNAIREMSRVASKGIIIVEPAKSLITKISVLLGISKDYEGKDFVYRFREEELKMWLKEANFKEIKIKRYIMYYPHKPGVIFKVLGLPVIFSFVKLGFYICNLLFGKFGNKIQVIGLK